MNIVTFEEVFKGRVFRIPDYQRGYSWTKKELEELWNDLSNTHQLRNTFHFTGILTLTDFTANDKESVRKEGFMLRGDTIFINNETFKGVNLVDGQQRLTTLLILLSELVALLEEGDAKKALIATYFKIEEQEANRYIFGYHVDVPSHNFLIREIFNDSAYMREETETLYTHNLALAKTFFAQRVSGFAPQELSFWIEKITKHLLFSILNLSESKERPLDVSMVFETLNFRGKQLSSLERLKNRVLYIVSKQLATQGHIDRSRKKVNQSWLEVYKWLGRNPEQAMDDDAFLKAFWLLYFSRPSMVSTDFKSYQKHLFTQDFQLDNEHLTVNYASYNELVSWLSSMRKAVVLWYFINNPYAVNDDEEFLFVVTEKMQKSIQRLNNFPRGYGKYMLNLILAILMRDLPYKDDALTELELAAKINNIERLLFAIERHNIMCYLLQGNNSNLNLEDTYRDINNYYLRGRTNQNSYLYETLMDTRVAHFKWREVSKHVQKGEGFKSWTGLEFFLKSLEEQNDTLSASGEPRVHLVYPSEDYYMERSAYKDLNSQQKLNRNKYTYSIGNMFLSYNKHEVNSFENIKNKLLQSMKNEYRLTSSELDLLCYEEWTKKTIEDRGRKMVLDFIDYWELPAIQDTEMNKLLLNEI